MFSKISSDYVKAKATLFLSKLREYIGEDVNDVVITVDYDDVYLVWERVDIGLVRYKVSGNCLVNDFLHWRNEQNNHEHTVYDAGVMDVLDRLVWLYKRNADENYFQLGSGHLEKLGDMGRIKEIVYNKGVCGKAVEKLGEKYTSEQLLTYCMKLCHDKKRYE